MTPFRALPFDGRLAWTGLCLVLALGASGTASAQYQWRDDQGRMVYSDLAPPTSVSPTQIIRAPEKRRVEPPKAATANVSASADAPRQAGLQPAGGGGAGLQPTSVSPTVPSATPVPGPTASAADREMAYRKRLAEQIEAEKKAAAEQTRKIELSKACNDARGDIRLLESGQRVSRVNAKGEREFLSDRERQERLESVRKNVSTRC